jgi:hypothetical protein
VRKVFEIDANYTLFHTLDDETFTTFVSAPQDLDGRSLERANSNQDVQQRLITNFTTTAHCDSFLRNFALSSIVTLQTGRPFSMFVGFDSNGDTNPVTDRVGDLGRNAYCGDHLYSWDLRVSRYFLIRERRRLDLMVDTFNPCLTARVSMRFLPVAPSLGRKRVDGTAHLAELFPSPAGC